MADFRSLDVRQLVAFDAVVRAGTFAQAAARLGYTQGAISQQIAALERVVGAPLFDRPGGPRPATLTPLGSFLADRTTDLLNRIDALAEEVDRVRDGRAGVLGIGSFQSVTAEVLPTVLAQMRQRFPDLQFRITAGETDAELLAALESGRADVAFLSTPAPRVHTESILADPWVVLAERGRFDPGPILPTVLAQMRQRFPDLQFRITAGETDAELLAALESGRADVAFLSAPAPRVRTESILADPWVVLAEPGRFDSGSIAPEALDGAPLIGQDNDTWQRQCEIELSALGVQPQFVLRTSDNATAAAMVRAGIGSALLPQLAAVDYSAGLEMHRIASGVSDRQILLALPTDRTVPPSLSAFVDITKAVCGDLTAAVLRRDSFVTPSG